MRNKEEIENLKSNANVWINNLEKTVYLIEDLQIIPYRIVGIVIGGTPQYLIRSHLLKEKYISITRENQTWWFDRDLANKILYGFIHIVDNNMTNKERMDINLCPFCSGYAKLHYTVGVYKSSRWFVKCQECNFYGKSSFIDEKKAISYWNSIKKRGTK